MADQARVEVEPPSTPQGLAFRYRRAIRPQEQEELFRLRYRCYLAEGAIDPNPTQRLSDHYDEDPNVFIFGIESENALVASIRIHVCSPDMPFAPGLKVFPDILEPLIEKGRSFVDPTRFVVDRSLRRAMGQMPFATVRMAGMAAEHFDTDYMLATVRAEHAPFYQRFCHMSVMTEPRFYPGLKRPICLMSGHFETMRQTVYPRYPHFLSTHRERVGLFGASRMIGLGMTDIPPLNDNDGVEGEPVAEARALDL